MFDFSPLVVSKLQADEQVVQGRGAGVDVGLGVGVGVGAGVGVGVGVGVDEVSTIANAKSLRSFRLDWYSKILIL